jgi:hypothetical protein
MSKRDTGIGAKNDKKSPHKTKKRLAAKREMIAIRNAKRDKKK